MLLVMLTQEAFAQIIDKFAPFAPTKKVLPKQDLFII
jgi:hypothetical protein